MLTVAAPIDYDHNVRAMLIEADVTSEASLDEVFVAVEQRWGGLDFLVHAIAFSDKEELKGKYLDTSRDNFLRTLDISCFSFTDLCRRAAVLMPKGGSLLTLTYAGAERVMPHYNVMGVAKAALESSARYLAFELGEKKVRVNTISAGPIRTLSAMAVGGIDEMFDHVQRKSPLKRNVEGDEVGKVAVYLMSDLSSGVAGENMYVDCGYNIVGL